jgi:hypothetical protein
MAEYEHGTMNTDAQEKAFDGFITYVTRGSIAVIGILVFMALFAR